MQRKARSPNVRTPSTACRVCGRSRPPVSSAIGLCYQCLPEHFGTQLAAWKKACAAARLPYGLPAEVPSGGKRTCRLCANGCAPLEGARGYCGLREVRNGKLVSLAGTGARGILDWYYDPLPTNCCADFVCPAGTYSPPGWERYSYAEGPEHGYRNLAVFYRSCSMGCLYCQNWHFREGPHPGGLSAPDLARAVDSRTACICFFGGDPSTQAPHAIRTAQLALRRAAGRILRICFETNGRWNPVLLDRAARLSLESGGCIKFDLKAWSPEVHRALTGFGPEQTRGNFERLVPLFRARREPPFLVATTLLVPGYVTEHEVGSIARWLASLDRTIPYSLLVFHPHFLLGDLPVTPRRQVEACLKAAREAGLQRLHVGNLHLLKD